MKKFTCGHCGGRIAIPPRLMGHLVVCPDCGKPTHPLAGEILAASRDGPPAGRSLSADPVERKCENCGRTVGRLEKVELWDNHIVCQACHPLLVRASPPPKPPPDPKREAAAAASPSPKPAPVKTRSRAKPKTLPAPVAAVNALALLPAPGDVPAASDAPTIILDRRRLPDPADPIPVEVTRDPGGRSTGDRLAGGPRATPAKFQHRLLALAAGAFVAGCALYGALTLLQNIMGYLLTIGLVLVATAVALVVAKIGLAYGRRVLAGVWGRRPTPTQATVPVARKADT